jgi:AGCS family alanine or glycine:cation symporter
MAESLQAVANAVFMPWVVVVLLGTGLFLTIRLRFVQFRRFGDAVRAMLAREKPGVGGVLTPRSFGPGATS